MAVQKNFLQLIPKCTHSALTMENLPASRETASFINNTLVLL